MEAKDENVPLPRKSIRCSPRRASFLRARRPCYGFQHIARLCFVAKVRTLSTLTSTACSRGSGFATDW
jgi:hypothetical protein